MLVNLSTVRTNRLKCGSCKRKIQVGESALFYMDNGKFHNVHCLTCESGKMEFDAYEEEQILIDVYDIGQF